MDGFILVPDLAQKAVVIDWPLSRVLLQSSRDFPWILLVPRLPGISQIHELAEKEQGQLVREISSASRLMLTHFPCDRVNVAAMGNKVAQLHVHIVCRDQEDPYWPEVIWHQAYIPLEAEALEQRRQELSALFRLENWKKSTQAECGDPVFAGFPGPQ
ncbi:MAG: HIT family protein [Puniceicoccales bacterium]|nr:HIT family protein [Puniceicoccales bacterium]